MKDDKEVLEENGRLRRMELLSQLRMVDNKLDSLSKQKGKSKLVQVPGHEFQILSLGYKMEKT